VVTGRCTAFISATVYGGLSQLYRLYHFFTYPVSTDYPPFSPKARPQDGFKSHRPGWPPNPLCNLVSSQSLVATQWPMASVSRVLLCLHQANRPLISITNRYDQHARLYHLINIIMLSRTSLLFRTLSL
jgi:hypothetical protein